MNTKKNKISFYQVSCHIELTYKGTSKPRAMKYGMKQVKVLGLDVSDIRVHKDYDDPSQFEISVTLEGTKEGKSSQKVIEDIISKCQKAKLQLESVNAYDR
mgnify:CR=1 FL=1|tara:strand:+ start:255 stop:557 length:303 start_codon:yes stop_codon:yes gene_type:complete